MYYNLHKKNQSPGTIFKQWVHVTPTYCLLMVGRPVLVRIRHEFSVWDIASIIGNLFVLFRYFCSRKTTTRKSDPWKKNKSFLCDGNEMRRLHRPQHLLVHTVFGFGKYVWCAWCISWERDGFEETVIVTYALEFKLFLSPY